MGGCFCVCVCFWTPDTAHMEESERELKILNNSNNDKPPKLINERVDGNIVKVAHVVACLLARRV